MVPDWSSSALLLSTLQVLLSDLHRLLFDLSRLFYSTALWLDEVALQSSAIPLISDWSRRQVVNQLGVRWFLCQTDLTPSLHFPHPKTLPSLVQSLVTLHILILLSLILLIFSTYKP